MVDVEPQRLSEDVVDESYADDDTLIEISESALSYFGADFDVAGLVRRLEDGDIIVPRFDPDESQGSKLEGFQRQPVWSKNRMEKFIESLLLGWPVPSIFLVLDTDQRYLVLDGQQRLTTLRAFLNGRYLDGSVFSLQHVAAHLKDATYKTLTPESKRRLNNTFIQATVIEPEGESGRESVYNLFGRLNSGGVALTAQEIRVALYRGPIIDWIRDLNHAENWRRLVGASLKRLKDHELILRTLALYDVANQVAGRWADTRVTRQAYKPPMSEFLNSYLARHRNLEDLRKEAIQEAFQSACEAVFGAAGADGLRYQGSLNAAHVDALLSSLMYVITSGSTVPTARRVRAAIDRLRDSTDYAGYVTTGTSHRESVFGRLRLATRELQRRR